MGTRKQIHYPWKDIVELMEKTKQSWRQGGTHFPFEDKETIVSLYVFSLLTLTLGVTLDSSSLSHPSSFPSGKAFQHSIQNRTIFRPLLSSPCVCHSRTKPQHFLPRCFKASQQFPWFSPQPLSQSIFHWAAREIIYQFNQIIPLFIFQSSNDFPWHLDKFLYHSPGLELYMSWPLPLLSPLLLSLAATLLSLSPAPLVSVTTSRMTMFSLFHSLFLQWKLVFLWNLYNPSLLFHSGWLLLGDILPDNPIMQYF